MLPTVLRYIDNGNGTTTVVIAATDLREAQVTVPNGMLDSEHVLAVYSLVGDMKNTQMTVPHVAARDRHKYPGRNTNDT